MMTIFRDVLGVYDTVNIVGGGPSLSPYSLSFNEFTIACNVVVPTTDLLFTADCSWLGKNKKLFESVTSCAALSPSQFNKYPDVLTIERRRGAPFRTADPFVVGAFSGMCAMALASKITTKRINLFGFDLCSKNGVSHHHNKYNTKGTYSTFGERWAQSIDEMKPEFDKIGVEVLNYTGDPDSLINAYKKVPLDSLLRRKQGGQ